MTSIIVFEFFLLLYCILVNMSVYILDFKVSFDYGVQLVKCFKWIFGHFMIIFSCFWSFFAAYLCNFCTFVVCLLQFLPFLSNLQVNFNELANIYPTALFPPNIYISNLVFCMVIYLYIYGCIEYYAEY